MILLLPQFFVSHYFPYFYNPVQYFCILSSQLFFSSFVSVSYEAYIFSWILVLNFISKVYFFFYHFVRILDPLSKYLNMFIVYIAFMT